MSKSFIESLESRQLLSLTMDLRVVGGGKTATVHKAGDVVHMEIWAVAQGANSTGSDESLQIVDGSILSTNVNGGAANGNLSAEVAYPFSAAGSTNGAQADLNGDGNLDVGSNDDSSANGFFFARADSLQSASLTGQGTVNGDSQEWLVGVADYTVTSLKSLSGSTDVNWRVRDFISAGLWREDGIAILKNGTTGDIEIGAPVVIKTDTAGGGGGGGGSTGSISGTIFNDGNKDGQFDSGDTALSNRKAFIDTNNNGKLDSGEKTATTNSSGVYTFTGLAAGTYHVRRADTPSGYSYTEPVGGVYTITLSAGQNVTGKDIGVVLGSTGGGGGGSGSISGTIFNDGNKDGKFDSGDTALSNRKAFIDTNNNGKLDSGEKTATTNSSGVYTFTGLAAGTYHVRRADTPSGYSYTEPVGGVYTITLSAGQHVTGKDIGVVLGSVSGGGGGGTASISGRVFNDGNKDGNFDSGESLLSNRKIYIDANKNGRLDSGEKTALSNSSGVYMFSGLAAGTYVIRRADTPAGYKIDDPVGGFYSLTLSAGQSLTGKDFGAVPI